MMYAKLSLHRFWPCHGNGLIKTIQTIPHNLYVSFKLTSLNCGLRIILDYPNLQQKEADLKLTYELWGLDYLARFQLASKIKPIHSTRHTLPSLKLLVSKHLPDRVLPDSDAAPPAPTDARGRYAH